MRGLLQGVDGGDTYEAYVRAYRRENQLADKCTQLQSLISTLEQFITILSFTTSIVANPSHVSSLGQLQAAIADKKKELQDMVIQKKKQLYN